MRLRFGLSTPANIWNKSVAEKIATLKEIEQAGFSHIYMADHVSFHTGAGTDGFVQCAALSQLSDRLGVMISIYLLPLRHPLPVARQMATIAEVAQNRFVLGVGVGGEDRHEFEVCEVNPATRGERTNEALDILADIMQGEEVSTKGKHFNIDKAKIRPTPTQPIPIIVGGRSDAALHRAAKYADGWVGVWCSPQRFKQATEIIAETATTLGRTQTQWQHGLQPWVGVADSAEEARLAVKAQMEAFYKIPFEKFERYTPYGTAQDVAEELEKYKQMGCSFFNLKICTPHSEEETSRGAEIVQLLKKA